MLTPVIPALWEAQLGGSWGQDFETSLETWGNPISTKNTKISQVCWWAPVIPATQEAEAGESLEPGRRRLQWAEITPLHSSLGDEQNSVSKNKNKNKNKTCWSLIQLFCTVDWPQDAKTYSWTGVAIFALEDSIPGEAACALRVRTGSPRTISGLNTRLVKAHFENWG